MSPVYSLAGCLGFAEGEGEARVGGGGERARALETGLLRGEEVAAGGACCWWDVVRETAAAVPSDGLGRMSRGRAGTGGCVLDGTSTGAVFLPAAGRSSGETST